MLDWLYELEHFFPMLANLPSERTNEKYNWIEQWSSDGHYKLSTDTSEQPPKNLFEREKKVKLRRVIPFMHSHNKINWFDSSNSIDRKSICWTVNETIPLNCAFSTIPCFPINLFAISDKREMHSIRTKQICLIAK